MQAECCPVECNESAEWRRWPVSCTQTAVRLLLPGEVLAQLHLDQPPLEGGPVHPSHQVIDLGEPFGVFYPHKTELFALTILGIDHLVSNVPCK